MTICCVLELDWPVLERRRLIGSLLVFVLWGKMFEWMRLFDATSFYIKLIIATVKDIIPFLMIHSLFLLCFGSAMESLSYNREPGDDVIGTYTGWWFIDVVIDQHLMSLGGFETENYGGKNHVLVYIFFFMATVFTSITSLNMIIAIMGNTFETTLDGYDKHSRQMKLALLSGYIDHIRPREPSQSPNRLGN